MDFIMEIKVEALSCEYRSHLLGTDIQKPRFSWKLYSARRGSSQLAYQIQVCGSNGDFTIPIWDTGRVDSDQSIQVEYEGPELKSRNRYHYRVKVWSDLGVESAWSYPDWWEMALLDPREWKANWITPHSDPMKPDTKEVFMLRKAVHVHSRVKAARIYATAAGVYEIYLNGDRVGDELLAPGWTSYQHRHQYQTYDVTSYLINGENGIGVQLGDGWYKGELTWLSKRNIYGDRRAVLLQLHIEYEDGTEEMIVTDPSWKCATGPILLSEFYAGETYDACVEHEGWSKGDFDDSKWFETVKVDLPYTQLVAQENWPTRVTEVLLPQAVIHTPSGEIVLDMGQNLVGRIRMKLNLDRGDKVQLQHAEVLDKEGNFYIGNLRKAEQTVIFIAKGEGQETYAPHFTFQGFRYVKLKGLDHLTDELLLESFAAEVIHSDMERTGSFECSHPMVNQLYNNIIWGQRGNFLDVPTDCPQRDERLGWTGDAQVFIRTAALNYNVGPFFTKWLRDLKADQRATGSVPYVIPNALEDYTSNMWGDETYTSSAWGDAAAVCPWMIYLSYGDHRLLAEQYVSMKAWVEYIRVQGNHEWLWNSGFHFGDWLALDAHEGSYFGATPVDLVATAYYALSTRILRDTAEVLGKEEDMCHYNDLLEGIIRTFRETFINSDGHMIARTQTSHILPLIFNLVEGETRAHIARELDALVKENDYHLTTGFVGTPYLCLALSENGYHDTAVKLLLQETYPSWLYSISKGATTIWEHWDGIKPDGTFWSDNMNSYNHYAYGAIGEWMYRYLAGLDMNETEAAYKRIQIRPLIMHEGLTYVRAALESPYGTIHSGWSVDGSRSTIDVTIPVNTTAELLLPKNLSQDIKESSGPIDSIEGILAVNETEEHVILTIGSGSYCFSIENGQ
jgi:alpha-L-rhamnosidase